jgi:tetratricopeptide (TPR) repeat protein
MTQTLPFEELVAEAKRLVKSGRYRDAREVYQQAEAISPDSTTVLHGLGTVCFLLGDFGEAIDYYRRVSQTDPLRGAAFINLGAVYNRSGRYEEAVDALRRGIRLDPDRAEGYFNLGIAHKGLGQLDLAVQAYREATRLNPRMADGFLNLGNLYVEMDRFNEAATQYKRALTIRPHHERAERGLKYAEQLLAQRAAPQQAVSPSAVVSQPHAATSRIVTDEERAVARGALHALAAHGEELVRQYLALIRTEMEPALKALENAFLKPFATDENRSEEFEKYRTALARFDIAREQLREHFGTLREEDRRF